MATKKTGSITERWASEKQSTKIMSVKEFNKRKTASKKAGKKK